MKTVQALETCGRSVTNLFVKIFEAQKQNKAYEYTTGHSITAEEVFKEWTGGGKKAIEGYWRDPANTPTKTMTIQIEDDDEEEAKENEVEEFWHGKHEWIPTNMLAYVLFYACKHNDIAWIGLAEFLRIPTRYVVVKRSKMAYPASTANPLGLTGHVGAVYVGDQHKQQTKGQSKFHDALRAILKQNLNDGSHNLTLFEDQFVEHVKEWYWLGETTEIASTLGMNEPTFRSQPCPYQFNSGTSQYSSWGATMGDMANALREGWSTWLPVAAKMFAAARHLQLKNVAQPHPTFPTASTSAGASEEQAIFLQFQTTAQKFNALFT